MTKDHIIPRFILKGFSKNPTSSDANQKVMVLDAETLEVATVKVADAFAIRGFNSEKTEKTLAYEYEDKVAKIFSKIKKKAGEGKKSITFSSEEYKLLFRFFIVMWRRNNVHLDNARDHMVKMEEMLKRVMGEERHRESRNPEHRDTEIEDLLPESGNEATRELYDYHIKITTDDDPTVQKTIKFYAPTIVHNKSGLNFAMHNSYGTMRYLMPKGVIEAGTQDMPFMIIEPISRDLCFCLTLVDGEVDLTKNNFQVPIDLWDNADEIEKHFLDGYIMDKATSYVVDQTNVDAVKKIVAARNRIKARRDTTDPQMQFIEEMMRTALKDPNPYEGIKIGRNDPCPCESGNKYKKCCLDKLREIFFTFPLIEWE